MPCHHHHCHLFVPSPCPPHCQVIQWHGWSSSHRSRGNNGCNDNVELSWQMSDVGMSARPPKRQTCYVCSRHVGDMSFDMSVTWCKNVSPRCRHDTRHVGFSDMSATCRRLHLRMFVVDDFVIDLTIAY